MNFGLRMLFQDQQEDLQFLKKMDLLFGIYFLLYQEGKLIHC